MIAVVDIDVKANDMFTASRHAQHLAGNFLADVDEFSRASREADRRAMSHFEPVDYLESSFYPTRSRRSVSLSRHSLAPKTTSWRAASVEPSSSYMSYPSKTPVTIVGSRYVNYYPGSYPSGRYYPSISNYPSTAYYPTASYYPLSNYLPGGSYYPSSGLNYPSKLWYSNPRYTPSYAYNGYYNMPYYDYKSVYEPLPTSHLRASAGPTRTDWGTVTKTYSPSRWYSASDLSWKPIGSRRFYYH